MNISTKLKRILKEEPRISSLGRKSYRSHNFTVFYKNDLWSLITRLFLQIFQKFQRIWKERVKIFIIQDFDVNANFLLHAMLRQRKIKNKIEGFLLFFE